MTPMDCSPPSEAGFDPASQSMSSMALTGPSRNPPDGPSEKIRFAQQDLPCLRASVQLARALEASVGKHCLLLKTLQRAAVEKAAFSHNTRSTLKRLELPKGVVRPLEHRGAIIIAPLAPAAQYQTHARVLTQQLVVAVNKVPI